MATTDKGLSHHHSTYHCSVGQTSGQHLGANLDSPMMGCGKQSNRTWIQDSSNIFQTSNVALNSPKIHCEGTLWAIGSLVGRICRVQLEALGRDTARTIQNNMPPVPLSGADAIPPPKNSQVTHHLKKQPDRPKQNMNAHTPRQKTQNWLRPQMAKKKNLLLQKGRESHPPSPIQNERKTQKQTMKTTKTSEMLSCANRMLERTKRFWGETAKATQPLKSPRFQISKRICAKLVSGSVHELFDLWANDLLALAKQIGRECFLQQQAVCTGSEASFEVRPGRPLKSPSRGRKTLLRGRIHGISFGWDSICCFRIKNTIIRKQTITANGDHQSTLKRAQKVPCERKQQTKIP